MSKDDSLVEILDKTLPFPPKIILGYKNLEPNFTSGDLARICDISRSSAKFYIGKMQELRLITKVPNKRKYQKYANANTFSEWMKDFIKFALEPFEAGKLTIPEDIKEN